jgi:flavin reductase (DIM6/NTAB) family NADH-FMN oxidoreductase RutF
MTRFRTFAHEDLPPGQTYHALNAIIGPRPISWISTVAPDGTFNLAPHSYTTVASQAPPVVLFTSIGRKDTIRNVEADGTFVYNVGNRSLVERINRTAADYPPDVSEFDWAGLTPIASEKARAPRVAEAPVQMECELVSTQRVLETENFLILGRVVLFHVAEELWDEDRINTGRLDPVGRLAGSLYAGIGEIFSLKRPTYRELIETGAEPMEPSGGS